jgi:hypothetical protein
MSDQSNKVAYVELLQGIRASSSATIEAPNQKFTLAEQNDTGKLALAIEEAEAVRWMRRRGGREWSNNWQATLAIASLPYKYHIERSNDRPDVYSIGCIDANAPHRGTFKAFYSPKLTEILRQHR